jgi:hypothetical protein
MWFIDVCVLVTIYSLSTQGSRSCAISAQLANTAAQQKEPNRKPFVTPDVSLTNIVAICAPCTHT